MKAGIALDTCQVQGDDRDLLHVCLLQGTADEADIVRRTASATGLAHDNGGLVQVIFAGQQCFHNLTDYQQGRIAGIVVDILQTHIYSLFTVIFQNLDLVAKGADGWFDQIKVDGGHLRAEQGVVLLHLFGKDETVVSAGHYFALEMLLLAHL